MSKSFFLSKKQIDDIGFKKVGKDCMISNLASFISPQNISISDKVRIDDFVQLSSYDGAINIGKNSHIGALTFIQGSGKIKIGKNCNISQGVKIYSKSDNYNSLIKKQILKENIIKKNVIIGSNAVILPGAIIESDCRIGALTIVKKRIKSNSLYYGKKTVIL